VHTTSTPSLLGHNTTSHKFSLTIPMRGQSYSIVSEISITHSVYKWLNAIPGKLTERNSI